MIKKKDVHKKSEKSEMGSSFCNLTNPDHHDRVFSMVIDFDSNPQLEVQITIHDGIVKVILNAWIIMIDKLNLLHLRNLAAIY